MPSRQTVFAVLGIFPMYAAGLVYFVLYILSIGQAYSVSLIWALVAAIPIFGQLIWFGVRWQSVGLFNVNTYLLVIVFLLYGIGSFFAKFAEE